MWKHACLQLPFSPVHFITHNFDREMRIFKQPLTVLSQLNSKQFCVICFSWMVYRTTDATPRTNMPQISAYVTCVLNVLRTTSILLRIQCLAVIIKIFNLQNLFYDTGSSEDWTALTNFREIRRTSRYFSPDGAARSIGKFHTRLTVSIFGPAVTRSIVSELATNRSCLKRAS